MTTTHQQTLNTYMNTWLRSAQVRPSTKKRYANCIEHINCKLGNVRLDELTPQHIRDHIYSLELKPSTQGIVLTALKAACNQAVEDGLIEKNPAKRVKKPVGASASRTRRPLQADEDFSKENVLSPKDVNELLDELKGSDVWLPTYTLWQTGLRRGELCGLRWFDIDFDNHRIHVRATATEQRTLTSPKTARSEGSVSITEELANLLIEKRAEPNHFVFSETPNKPVRPGTFAMRLRSQLKGSRFEKVTPHDLRHSHGSALLDAGWSIARVANRLRDSQATLVKTYSHEILNEKGDEGLANLLCIMC